MKTDHYISSMFRPVEALGMLGNVYFLYALLLIYTKMHKHLEILEKLESFAEFFAF